MTTNNQQLDEAKRLVQGGSLDEAEAICQAILTEVPANLDALLLAGGIHCRRSQFQKGVEYFAMAAELQPNNAIIYRNLGYALSSAGNREAAVDAYKRSLQLTPRNAQVFNDLGATLRQLGKLEEAAQCFQQAVALNPGLTLPRRSLGEALFAQGKHDDAIAALQDVIRRAPADARAYNELGNVFASMGRAEEAISAYENALRYEPQFAMAENNIATVLRSEGRLDEAVEHCRRALELQEDRPEAHANLGSVLKLQGKVEEAIELNQQALRLQPQHVDARNNLGSILTDLGRFDEAIEHLEEVLRTDPHSIRAYHNLGDLAANNRYQFSPEQLACLETVLASDDISDEDATLLHSILAGIYAKQHEYDQAFESYRRSNDTKQSVLEKAGIAFDGNEHSEFITSTINTFDAETLESLAAWGSDSETPVFVIGMPRSGTTLVEQIIASHPEAAGVGELRDVRQIATDLPTLLENATAFPGCITQVTERAIADSAQRYLDGLAARASGVSRIVDKMWANFAYLGFIFAMFPKARIIHCQREPMDVCLSCYQCNFNSIRWACRLEDIGLYFREYKRTMDHWRAVLPASIHDVPYEQMVADPEGMSRQLISFCGLEWSDRCLEFYNQKQAVQTASRVQVRRPIYSTSVGRWKKYETHLLPLQQAINETTEPSQTASTMPSN